MKSGATTDIYILTGDHMEKIEEIVSELQCVYLDIFSNRGLSVTQGLEKTPASAIINAAIENEVPFNSIF